MATFTTDWLLPRIATTDDSIGDTSWVELDDLLLDDGSYATFSFVNLSGVNTAALMKGHLVINDVIDTANNVVTSNDQYPFANAGGSSNVWGHSGMTGADVKSRKFGVAFGIGRYTYSGGTYANKAYYLVLKDFNPTIPDNAIVTGIEATFDTQNPSTGGGTDTVQYDAIKIRFTFSWDIEVNGNASSFGTVYVNPPNREAPQKKYRFKVRSEDGDYLGDWKDPANDPSFKQEINNVIGSMPITLARNDLTLESAVDYLLNENDSQLTNEDDSPFLIDTSPVIGLGNGTTLDTNHQVEVDAIYGQFEPLLNEDDSPILNEDGSTILVEEGYPLGRTIFRGYVPRWELPLNGSPIRTEIRSFSQDLANIILETDDVVYVDTGLPNNLSPYNNTIGIAGGGPTDYDVLYQSFTIAAQKTFSKVRLNAIAGWYFDVDFSVSIFGGTPSSFGTAYGGGSAFANRDTPEPYTDVVFDSPITLPAGTYFFMFTTSQAKTGGNVTYPINFGLAPSTYSGGSLWYYTNDTGLVNDTSKDIAFTLYEAGGDTSVPFLSKDPSQILRSIVDFARSRGANINYTADSIEVTETLVSYTFNTNTIKEAIDKVLELAPANWYYYYDFGTDTIYFREKRDTPDRWLRKGQSVVDGKIVKTIEQVVNDVLFSGGGSPTNLFKRTRETPASGTRKGLAKRSDNRVTDSATAVILSQGVIDQFKDPLYAGDVTITEDGTFYLEDVAVGETVGFIGFGTIVDAIVVQSVSKDYRPDIMPLELTYNVPRVNKRIEDIKRNLEVVENKNNPAEPS